MKQNVISLCRLPDIVNREYTGMRLIIRTLMLDFYRGNKVINFSHTHVHAYIHISLSLSLSLPLPLSLICIQEVLARESETCEARREARSSGKGDFPVCRCGVKGGRMMRNFVDGADKSVQSSPLDDTMRAEETVPRHDRLCHYCVTYKAPSRRRTPHTNETASRWLLQNPRKKRPTGHVMYSRIRARVVSCGS